MSWEGDITRTRAKENEETSMKDVLVKNPEGIFWSKREVDGESYTVRSLIISLLTNRY
jgi:hypothetical protein